MTAANLSEFQEIARRAGTDEETAVEIASVPPLKIHDAARLFPEMPADEFKAFKEDIRQHGIRQPILVHRGEILDGRHRYKACLMLAIECPTIEWNGEGDALALVVSLNLKRRHLTQSQVAAIAAEALPLYQQQAKERQRAAGRDKTAVPAKVQEAVLGAGFAEFQQERGEAAEHAARDFGVSSRYVYTAARIQRENPQKFEKIKHGETTISKAKAIRGKQAKRPPIPPESPASAESAEVVRLQKANTQLQARLGKVQVERDQLRKANVQLRKANAQLRAEIAQQKTARGVTLESNQELRRQNAELQADLAKAGTPA